ncbi:symmetrical bis(5'-nucleosyl)-tetraphosphatase [Marinomonas mediterranea]|uniref:symmetrical bis(5'-nucleosyl)-tetraphosphatase n=1 Tax=Marinomonas mediterranea TaxID=119864 RepID=UPI00234B9779|nr:symmetrical bis(5'-nucleosyl)-tetraphosphatase [Marinomonas mediterranea]WCN08351.1 symmetrical bis(5'-nucleosyl)-tetraphosphatase [Marinomonas mediterranea]
MSTYAIGDLQGCLTPLLTLLDLIEFSPDKDRLWFAGDLINRGPESLKTLRFVKSLGDKATVVLGNHDLHLLAVMRGHASLKRNDTLADILLSEDRDELMEWLQSRPLCHIDNVLKFVMTHAGIPPCWDSIETQRYAQEVERTLSSDRIDDFLAVMYGNKPDQWDDNLIGMDRLRTITNYLTRMRFCTESSQLEFKSKEGPTSAISGYAPWFSYPRKKADDYDVIFGHWAALEGNTYKEHIHALDTGCVWGGALTAMRLEDKTLYSTPCPT